MVIAGFYRRRGGYLLLLWSPKTTLLTSPTGMSCSGGTASGGRRTELARSGWGCSTVGGSCGNGRMYACGSDKKKPVAGQLANERELVREGETACQ